MNITLSDTALVTLTLIVTVFIGFYNVMVIRRTVRAEAFRYIFDMVQRDEAVNARGFVFTESNGELFKKPFSIWDVKTKATAEKAANTYDLVGLMVKEGVVPVRLIARPWNNSICKTWDILTPMIEAYTKERGESYYMGFRYLEHEARKYYKMEKPRMATPEAAPDARP